MCYCTPNIRTPKCNRIDCVPKNDYKRPVEIDWSMNMANSISAQILQSEPCKKDYVRILAMALLKIDEAIKNEANYAN